MREGEEMEKERRKECRGKTKIRRIKKGTILCSN